jgi:Cu2+-exporting ATPase
MDHGQHHQHDHPQHEHHHDHHGGHQQVSKQKDITPAHDEHAGHHTHDFLKRFWICLALTIPVLLLSHMIRQWIGLELSFSGDKWILLILSTIIFLYGGQPFLTGLIRELKFRSPGMMTLVAVAITVAYVYSVAVIFGFRGMDFFWELATLIDIMLLGHWLEMKSQMAASRALESLVQLMPSTVHIEINGGVHDIPLKDLGTNSTAIIKPGEKIPADGVVIDGESFVNESMMTGESMPVKKFKDERVIGGSINGDGMIRVKVTGAGENSYLSKVINMVQSAQGTKSQTQNLANKVAMWLTIISLTVGIVTLVVWLISGNEFSFALERMVTVMVTSCPHALGVAIPLVVAISTSVSATKGLLIRNRTAFENARKLTTIIFDKTGTLTKGSHEIQQIITLSNDYNPQQVLQFAAAVQQHSEHHIAQGILKKLNRDKLELWRSENFKYLQGMGVIATVNGKEVVAAGPNYFTHNNIPMPGIPDSIDQSAETVNFVLIDGKPIGIITLADAIRENSKEAIDELKKMGLRSFLLTGDNEKVAAAVAGRLGMDGYLANVLPHEKQEKVKEFQTRGEVVAMIGDGVNDAPALAQADIGIAVGSGTDVAAETADIILVNSDPKDVVLMITAGRATYRKMIENLAWAVGYNVIAIPLAAGILYPTFLLSPALGAVLMSASTIIVAMNAQLLRRSLARR